ncbi:helix-turn-helix domain-containing protein [Bacillus sp. FJAT-49705]|uniref:Helix-turn-helix domain-containing protein n=1 Tax=Cytobacillus citreus TaxID=2833586 RepID=A0ABS5NX45_9BACI|nr:helix-turn-helix domain-containing protein [Cytobacillus citreus]MBS4190162.1 helix-turn-helix domain-containing protein [Cytobacillus citreus]MBS4192339.1 helix-turn-helix domain-containing protein [Cytobacillus citreus]MBS4192400.1 helix-turn-helix domain-containing protein [Cytobacillus citreus]
MTRKHTSVETKLKAVLQIIDGEKSVIEAARGLNLHRDTVNRWVNAYKERGEKGLENPHSHSTPQSKNSNKKVKELEKKLKEKELENEILKKFQAFLKENE